MSTELLELIDMVTREKGVEEEDVYEALEQALLKIAMERYGDSPDLSVTVDRNTGNVDLFYAYTVAESPAHVYEISLPEANLIKEGVAIGEKVYKKLAFTDFSRTSKKIAANELYKNLEMLRRAREYAEFKDKIGEMVSGVVKRTQPNGDLIVTLGKGIGYLSTKNLLPCEVSEKKYRPGNPIKVYVLDVKEIKDTKIEQYQITLSRTHEQFLAKLMAMEVPEVQDGSVEIKGVVRIPGVRAKVAVVATERGVDPLGACIGAKGARISNVISELKGECIDVIYWSESVETFAINALKPAEILRAVSIDDNLIITVDREQKNKAIGFKGSNILLASALTKMRISIFTEEEERARHKELCKFLELALNIDADMANLLIKHGFENIKDLNSATDDELSVLPGFDQDLVAALRERVEDYLSQANAFYDSARDIDMNIKHIPAIKMLYVQKLYENGVRNMEDISKLTEAQMMEYLKDFELSTITADKIVKYAQKKILAAKTAPRYTEKYASRGTGDRTEKFNVFDKRTKAFQRHSNSQGYKSKV